jgi:type II secretory pathway component GspD/PulD (secretin)
LLDLHPENNSYGYDEKGQVVISTQEAKTKVVVADGETVVIGGLTRNENTESESGIPFLKDIPLLGNLFKYTRKAVTKRDLIIFVTPRIIRNYVGSVELSEASADIKGTPTAKKTQTSTEPTDNETPIVEPKPKQEPAQERSAEPSEAPAAPAIEEDEGWN